MTSPKAHTYHKGDNKSGGGGGHGGGGKRKQPQGGWEKGDVSRGIADLRAEAQLPRKPGREINRVSRLTAEPEQQRLPVLESLRRTNDKLLLTLRKLDNTGRPDERAALLELVTDHLSQKRTIEANLFPLLDEGDIGDEIAAIREIDRDIEHDLKNLRRHAPTGRAFAIGVEVLYGDIERRIERERRVLMPAWAAALGPEQAIDLASSTA